MNYISDHDKFGFYILHSIHTRAPPIMADNNEVIAKFRRNYQRICNILNISASNLSNFAGELFAEGLIDRPNKIAATRKGGLEGASLLLDILMSKMTNNPNRCWAVLAVMEKNNLLEDIAREIKSSIKSTEQLTSDGERPRNTLAKGTEMYTVH